MIRGKSVGPPAEFKCGGPDGWSSLANEQRLRRRGNFLVTDRQPRLGRPELTLLLNLDS